LPKTQKPGKGLDSNRVSMKRDRMPSPEKMNESGSNGGVKWPRWKQWNSNKGEYKRDPLEVQPPWIGAGTGSSSSGLPPVPEDQGLVLPQSNPLTKIEEDQEFENSTYEAVRETEVAFQQALSSTFEAIQKAVNTTFEVPQGSSTPSSEGKQVFWDKDGGVWEEWGGDWWKRSTSGWWEKWQEE